MEGQSLGEVVMNVAAGLFVVGGLVGLVYLLVVLLQSLLDLLRDNYRNRYYNYRPRYNYRLMNSLGRHRAARLGDVTTRLASRAGRRRGPPTSAAAGDCGLRPSLPPPPSGLRVTSVNGLRVYRVGDLALPSVTSVLDIAARPRRADWTRRGTAAAADKGLAVHDAIAAALAGDPPDTTWEAEVAAALAFLEDSRVRPLATEYTVISRRYGFGGTTDLVGLQDGALVLVDWKTGHVHQEHALQVAAYAIALEEMAGVPVAAGYVVKLSPDGYEAFKVNLDEARPGFVSVLDRWRALRGPPLEKVQPTTHAPGRHSARRRLGHRGTKGRGRQVAVPRPLVQPSPPRPRAHP